MILVDSALKRRESEGAPLRVAMFGAGFMASGIANQIMRYTPGMTLVAVCNRTPQTAVDIFVAAGVDVSDIAAVSSASELNDQAIKGHCCVTDDPAVLCESLAVDVLIESTGNVEYGAHVISMAIRNGKHVVNMNAELDATVGPWLKHQADSAGCILSGCDGDQPGVQINLCRFIESMGMKPLVCGNIKGLQDRYRTPATQAEYAKVWGQTPSMVTSFADGTKISFEQAIVANATGMKVYQPAMIGYEHDGHVDDMIDWYDYEQVKALGGIVDYVVGPTPGPGVYVFAEAADDDRQKHYLKYGKLGEGPMYSFYTPYHLTVLEVPLSAARVGLFGDSVIEPVGAPVVDVVTVAKCDLKAGDTIDGLGGFKSYGICVNAEDAMSNGYLPMGIANGCVLKTDRSKDAQITYSDVELPTDSLAIELRSRQDQHFWK